MTAAMFKRNQLFLSVPLSYALFAFNYNSKRSSCLCDEKVTEVNDQKANIHFAQFKKQKNVNKWNSNWDMRNGTDSKVVHQIVMIRHGQYDSSSDHEKDHVLTSLGQEQATQTGVRLRNLLDNKNVYPIKKIYYSTMCRATETFQYILPSLPPLKAHQIQPCSMIREGAVCVPEPPSSVWKVEPEEFVIDGARVKAAFLNYFHRAAPEDTENYSTVMVCHGNVIRYFVMRALQLSPEAWLRTGVNNASITIIEIRENGNVSLRCMGDVGHLPVDYITYN